MGVKQSKRSVDITETSTKGEIEGFGNEGKVEKIVDGVVEKVAANGHVDGDLQNGIEALQNGGEVLQNGEAATVATEKFAEKRDVDESSVEGVVNGQVEANGEVNGEMNGEAEKSEEGKKTDEKKEKKKEKKEKAVKKKFSLRNFSFSRKDKSKPLKEEKSAGKVDGAETEETVTSPEKEIVLPSQEVNEIEKPEESTKPVMEATISAESATVSTLGEPEIEAPAPEKIVEVSSTMQEDLPPPLPASPPPSEPVEGKLAAEVEKLDISQPVSEKPSGETCEVTSSISNILSEQVETTQEIIKNMDQMAMETGKQIEEKATNLLKTVEERAGAVAESLSQKMEMIDGLQAEEAIVETKEEKQDIVMDEASKLEETVTGIPVEISNVDTLSPKGEEPTEKHEEGAGESLADIPKDLTDEVTAAAIEVSTPDSLEVSATIPPPPVVEPVTGE